MNKVVTINLGGTAYQLEEGGYDILRAYLETAAERLQHNPDREEILSDIEWAIAEKFRALLGNHKTVVVEKEVTTVLSEMGPIEADGEETAKPGGTADPGAGSTNPPGSGNPFDAHRDMLGSLFGRRAPHPGGASGAGAKGETGTAGGGGTPKRLHRIPEGAMIAGVCNGIAAYLHIDPTLLRLAFVFLTMLWGTGVVVYIIMMIVVPEAHTPEEKAAATGDPSTAQEFIRRARAGYYEAVKGFPDGRARREWPRRFKREMRAHAFQWRHNWQSQWGKPGQGGPVHPGMGFALPVLSVLHGMVNVVWACALVSLLATGNLFGVELPANVPVWLGVVGLVILYGVFAGPLKIARRACHWGMGQGNPAWSLIFLADGLVGFAVFAVLAWLAYHFFPEVREAVQSIPAMAHQAATDIQTWWKTK